jgi:hypothetical protein
VAVVPQRNSSRTSNITNLGLRNRYRLSIVHLDDGIEYENKECVS